MMIKTTSHVKTIPGEITVRIDRSCDHCIDVMSELGNFLSLTKEEADELQTKLSQALQELEV